tara:strand:- start:475 stop:711 length:237 start_codon:yes stop_codon:yes gene_type:complete
VKFQSLPEIIRKVISFNKMADNFDQRLLHVLICPVSAGPLDYDEENQELISDKAGLAYPIRNGIPIMLPSEARKLPQK